MSQKDIKQGSHSINMLEKVTMLDLVKMQVYYYSKIELNNGQLKSLSKSDLIELIQLLIKKNNDNCYKIEKLNEEIDNLQSCLNEYL